MPRGVVPVPAGKKRAVIVLVCSRNLKNRLHRKVGKRNGLLETRHRKRILLARFKPSAFCRNQNLFDDKRVHIGCDTGVVPGKVVHIVPTTGINVNVSRIRIKDKTGRDSIIVCDTVADRFRFRVLRRTHTVPAVSRHSRVGEEPVEPVPVDTYAFPEDDVAPKHHGCSAGHPHIRAVFSVFPHRQ